MTRRLRAAFVTIVVAGATAAVLDAQNEPPNGTSTRASIAGPDNWIPLSYEEVTKVDGVITQWYTHHRTSNGSTRRDGGDGRESVTNREHKLYFVFRSGGWRQHPARTQIKNGMPFLQIAREGSTSLSVSDPRLKAIAAISQALTFYEVTFSGKNVHIFVPELNMLEAWTSREAPYGHVQAEVTWIALGEPAIQLEPPPRAAVGVSNVPDGPGRP